MEHRPNPDDLLRRVQAEERKQRRGRLTIFFGAAPGVGKTFTMLQEAGYQRDVELRDVVVGVVETHGRFETATMLAGFERLPRKQISHRGATLEEFDLDAALARGPSLLLVDELAHTNAEGSRHPKRWQDVDELLEAGIEVFTTMNVQHVESLNDVVAQITGVVVRETVPDSVLDMADEIKLVDLPPDDLLERLREGKVYVPAQAERAIENFFRKGNLIALRELALRKTAECVDAEMQEYRRAHGVEATWAASDRILVCISPSPYSANLLRAGRRIASSLHAEWYAVNVETSSTLRFGRRARSQMASNLRLAEQLGAETVTLTGASAADEILRFARSQNVTKIVVGKPRVRRLRDRFGTSFVDQLVLGSGDIDVYVTAGEGDGTGLPEQPTSEKSSSPPELGGYVAGVAAVTVATVVAGALFGRRHLADVVMSYLLGIVLVSTQFSFRASLATAILSVMAFDFFFVPPFLTFTVTDLRHIVTFAVMLLVAVVIAGLAQRVKDQVEVARRSERRSAALYAMSRDLNEAPDQAAQLRLASRHFEELFEAQITIFARDAHGRLEPAYRSSGFDRPLDKEEGLVRWVASHRREAGLGTDTVPGAAGFYVPLAAHGSEVLGVLGVYPNDPIRLSDSEQRRLAEALAMQLALALERARLATETERARIRAEAEQLRSTLLSSVSHDLRTPLAVMKGAASMLVDADTQLTPTTRAELSSTLLEETERLERLVTNLLDMTRLELGAVQLKKEWQSVEEAVGGAVNRMEARLGDRPVSTDIPSELYAPYDSVLLEQLLVNLLENVAKHTPPGTPVEINASADDREVVIEVADRGPGLPPGEETRIFDKFQRGPTERTTAGFGLGLAICRAIATAHGGRIWAENRAAGGVSFKLALPLAGHVPVAALPEISDSRADAPVP